MIKSSRSSQEDASAQSRFGLVNRICKRIWSYPGTTPCTQVNKAHLEAVNKPYFIKSSFVIKTLMDTVKTLGPEKYGIDISCVGTHSVLKSFAMMLSIRKREDS